LGGKYIVYFWCTVSTCICWAERRSFVCTTGDSIQNKEKEAICKLS